MYIYVHAIQSHESDGQRPHTVYVFIIKSCLVIPLQFVSTLTPSKEHYVEGKKFYFRVTILQATGIPRDFTNVFVQFKYVRSLTLLHH